jgi:hypothetical protein
MVQLRAKRVALIVARVEAVVFSLPICVVQCHGARGNFFTLPIFGGFEREQVASQSAIGDRDSPRALLA